MFEPTYKSHDLRENGRCNVYFSKKVVLMGYNVQVRIVPDRKRGRMITLFKGTFVRDLQVFGLFSVSEHFRLDEWTDISSGRFHATVLFHTFTIQTTIRIGKRRNKLLNGHCLYTFALQSYDGMLKGVKLTYLDGEHTIVKRIDDECTDFSEDVYDIFEQLTVSEDEMKLHRGERQVGSIHGNTFTIFYPFPIRFKAPYQIRNGQLTIGKGGKIFYLGHYHVKGCDNDSLSYVEFHLKYSQKLRAGKRRFKLKHCV